MSWDTPYCCIHLPALCVLYTETFSRLLGPPEKGMALGAEQSFFPSSYPCLNLASVLPESSDANARDFIVAAPTTALIAAAAATYLDAKFHISKDIRTISLNWGAERHYARAVKSNRLSIYYSFEEAVKSHSDAQAIWSRQGEYTWREAYVQVCQYAAYFLESGVRPGDLVAFYLQNSPEFCFAWIGLLAIGSAPAMINFNLSGDALLHCLRISGAAILLVDEDPDCKARTDEQAEKIKSELHMRIIPLSEDLKREIGRGEALRIGDEYRKDVCGDTPIALLYTSGTTGLSKASPFTTARAYHMAKVHGQLINTRYGHGSDRWYICMPLYHASAGINTLLNFANGTSNAIGKKFSARAFWTEVRDSESTVILYVGETARYLLAALPNPLDKNHKVRCMFGNGLRSDVWVQFRERFGIAEVFEFFGSTEGVFATFNYCRGDYLANAVGHNGAIERFILRNKIIPVEIDYETGTIVRDPKTGFAKRGSYEEGGEIIVRVDSETAFSGYRMAPEATSKKFVKDVLCKGDLYYRTGDALRRTSDGRWFFLDRLGDTFRWKSENVSTAEVGEVIGKFPGILEANVYGVSVPGSDGKAGCAAIIIAPDQRSHFPWSSLAHHARSKLPKYAVPVFIRVVESELGSMGSHNNKQNKLPLREEGVNPALRGTKVAGGEKDQIFWIPPKTESYIKFEEKDWQSLVEGKARL